MQELSYIIPGAALCVLSLVLIATVILRKKSKLSLVSEVKVNDKSFYAVRLEGEDFLFLKDETSVKFIDSLDEVEDFAVLNLYDMQNPKISDETLEIPDHEKAS